MTSLVIVGNGFDRFHKLPTGYKDYKTFLEANHRDVLCAFEQFPYLHEDEKDRWGDVEETLTLTLYDECVEEALDAYPLDLFADNPGWNDPAIWIGTQTAFVKDFTGDLFLRWLHTIDVTKAKGEVLFPEASVFVTFNYTTTLEDRYGVPASRILHIHGSMGEATDSSTIQFGSPYNDPVKVRNDLEKQYGDDDFYGAMIWPCVLELEQYCEAGGKCLSDNYQALCDYINQWEIDRVIVFGHGFAGVDRPYYDDVLVPRLGKLPWTFVARSEDSARRAACFCHSVGIEDYSVVSSKDVSIVDLR